MYLAFLVMGCFATCFVFKIIYIETLSLPALQESRPELAVKNIYL